jgi:hypothetical protein
MCMSLGACCRGLAVSLSATTSALALVLLAVPGAAAGAEAAPSASGAPGVVAAFGTLACDDLDNQAVFTASVTGSEGSRFGYALDGQLEATNQSAAETPVVVHVAAPLSGSHTVTVYDQTGGSPGTAVRTTTAALPGDCSDRPRLASIRAEHRGAEVWFTDGSYAGATGYQGSTDGGLTWTALTAFDRQGQTEVDFSNLTDGVPVLVAVRATTATSTSSAAGAWVTPLAAPPSAAPSAPTVTPGFRQAVLTFTPPPSGDDPVTGYQACYGDLLDGPETCVQLPVGTNPDGTVSGTLTGLRNDGTQYVIWVRAVDAAGAGPNGPSTFVTLEYVDPIDTYYRTEPGVADLLGAPTGAEFSIAGGSERDYARGAIFSSQSTGTHEMHGAILTHYRALGGPNSVLGFPDTAEYPVQQSSSGRATAFRDGAIVWSPQTGAWSLHGAIYAKWWALGGATGVIGYPITDETVTPDHVGRFNHFSGAGGASVYWSPSTGAWSIHGAIRAKWASMGWETGPLGYPTSDETGTPDGLGRFNHFNGSGGASVYWTARYGAWSIRGAIRAKWASMGWETGFLGYPVSDEQYLPTGPGATTHFASGGSIYWSTFTGAWSVHGAIQATWGSLGWEAGDLAYPTSDEYGVPGGVAENFYNGVISYAFATGRTTVSVRRLPFRLPVVPRG